MKSASLSALRTMILAGVLVTSALVTFAQSTPLSYPTYRRRELEMVGRPEFSLLFDQTHGLENLPYDSSSSREASLVRPKRIGSLSIVNPLDVLRQRVLLELARRKMRQDQWQVDANRRFLQTIGKRSNSDYESDGSELSEIEGNDVFKNDELIQNKKQRSSPDRNSAKTQDQWYSDDNPDLREAQDDTQRNTQMANELHLL